MATATQPAPGLHLIEPNLDAEASTTTSPLSEVEDKDGLPDGLDNNILASGKPLIADDDSDSNLSDAGNDTEAETERLYDTPMIQRHKSVVIDQFNQDHIIEKTPTRLGRTVKSPPIGSDDLDGSYASDGLPQSPLPNVASKLANQKRKRSPDTEASENGQPNLKRSVSGALSGRESTQVSTLQTLIADPLDNSCQQPSIIDERNSQELKGTDSGIAGLSRDSKPPNGIKSGGASTNSNSHDDMDVGSDDDAQARSDHDHDHDADIDEEAEAAARNEEECKANPHFYDGYRVSVDTNISSVVEKKRIALEEWAAIEARFVTFRDRLFKDRLDKLEKEEQSLLADEPYHPEYLAMKQCIDERYETKIRHIDKEYEYVLKAHEQVAIATRAQIWSQFYQGMREKREEFLELLNKDWYDTQNIRRKAHSVPDVALLYPSTPAQQTRNAIAYNTEVSILSGIAKHVGFPAVPMMLGASELEVEDDLNAIKHVMYQPHNRLSPVTVSTPAPTSVSGQAINAPQAMHDIALHPATIHARDRSQAPIAMPAVSIPTSISDPLETSTDMITAAATATGDSTHVAPTTAIATMPPNRTKASGHRSSNASSRRTGQAKAKDVSTSASHSTVANRSRLSSHVPSNVLPPPLRPSMDATRA
ncbi:hypothetical protein Cpir12675_005398 [Ceratocystis pirilliformis]|uniref:Transcriptional regulatory protein DEP1 n=1 Tax=Ceratocystis pirilliformis TaxID=259994 RepID=A0ABR3YRI3_9PEZI